MGKKHQITPLGVLAGGAAVGAAALVLAPIMLKVGYRTLRKYAEQYELDMETGTIHRKDRNVVILENSDYEIKDHSEGS